MLEVEDGTGKANADALVTSAFVDSYTAARGIHAWQQSPAATDEKDAAIRRGTTYILGRYRGMWSGARTNGRDQALDWPRIGATDADGEIIEEDEIPIELMNAVAEASWREYQSPGSLTPDVVSTTEVKRTKDKLGPLETEVEYLQSASATSRPEVQLIDELLAPLFSAATGGARTVYITRA